MNAYKYQPETQKPLSTVIPSQTHAMIVDVLAGKIMTELSAARPHAARETAVELFGLLEQGVSTGSINANYLIMQIMDIYTAGQYEMAEAARGYFTQLCKYGLDLSGIDTEFLRTATLQISEHARDAKLINAAQNFTRQLMASSLYK